jgi:hypothetical protein
VSNRVALLQPLLTNGNSLRFFAQPFLNEQKAIELISNETNPTAITVQALWPRADSQRRTTLGRTSEAERLACTVYLARAKNLLSEADMEAGADRLFQLLAEVAAGEPGEHTLVWPYFVAGAETRNPERRAFLAHRIQRIYATTGYNNVRVALDTLQVLWSTSSDERWTARLPKLIKVPIM